MKSALFTTASLVAALAMAAVVTPAHADGINLVQNGDFSINSGSGSMGTTVADWTSTGYNFIYTSPASAEAGAGGVALWTVTSSPNGGAFVAGDGVYQAGPITQRINGLVAGQVYAVSFDYAGAQQSGYTGPTTEGWEVSLGGGTAQDTTMLSDASHSSTPWTEDTMYFTATSSSEVLSFLALGTPGGEPPFSLLDGVSLTATPEPSSLALLATGLLGVGGALRSRSRKNVA